MTYQVLARKYRPQGFFDVVGQDAVVQTIERALSTGRIAHAFLFTGSRGIGKTTLARILARCLTCEQGPTSRPCGTCRLCTSITAGQAVDVVEIDGASNTGVDQVRDLQEMARFLPQLARFKIFIIDEVHMLTTSAFNALLKTLEEPPPHLKFIFATTEPHKIPVTVLSRCQRYDFRRIPSSMIVARLEAVLAAERVRIERAGLDVIARAAEGGMRDALSLTDQVLSFAGAVADADAPITAAQVVDALGLIDRRTIAAALQALINGDARGCLSTVEAAFLRGFDLKQLLTLLAEELRHVAVAQATGTIRGFADLAEDDVARLDDTARAVDPRDVLRLLGMALDGVDVVGRAEDPRIALELVLLKMCRRAPLGDAVAISEALVRLERLSRGQPVPPLIVREAPTSVTARGIASQAFVPPPLVGATPGPPPAPPAPSPPALSAPALAPPALSPPALSASSLSPVVPAAAAAPPAPPPVGPAATPAPPATPSPSPSPSPSSSSSSATVTSSSSSPSSSTTVAHADGEDEPHLAVVVAPRRAATEEGEDAGDDPGGEAASSSTPAPPTGPGASAAVAAADDDEDDADPLAGLPLAGVDPRWRAFVARLQRQRAGVFRMVRVKHIGDGVIELASTSGWGVDEVNRLAADATVAQALTDTFGAVMRLIVAREDGVGVSIHDAEETLRRELQEKLEAHARAHPLVQKAVALFGGEVRAVRRV